MPVTSPRFAFWLLIFVCFVWGALFLLVNEAIDVMSTHTFNGLRFSLAATVLLPLWYLQKKPSPPSQSLRGALLIRGMLLGLLLFLGFATQTEGLRYTSVSNAGFITGLNVTMVPLLGLIIFRSRISIPMWCSVALATVGLYLLTVGDKLTFNSGDALILACALCFALHIIFTGRFARSLPVLPLTIIQLAAVAIYSFIARLVEIQFFENSSTHQLKPWYELISEPVVMVALLISALLGSALAYWAQTSCQQLLPPTKVALIFASEPLFAHGAAVNFLAESLGTLGWVGAAMIIIAMIVAELGSNNHPPKRTTTS